MDLKRGLKRIYFSAVVLWIGAVAAVFPLTIDYAGRYGYWDNVMRVIMTPRILPLAGWALVPPLALSLIFGLAAWIARGFRKDFPNDEIGHKDHAPDHPKN